MRQELLVLVVCLAGFLCGIPNVFQVPTYSCKNRTKIFLFRTTQKDDLNALRNNRLLLLNSVIACWKNNLSCLFYRMCVKQPWNCTIFSELFFDLFLTSLFSKQRSNSGIFFKNLRIFYKVGKILSCLLGKRKGIILYRVPEFLSRRLNWVTHSVPRE